MSFNFSEKNNAYLSNNAYLLKGSQILTHEGYKNIEDLDPDSDFICTVLFPNKKSKIKRKIKYTQKSDGMFPTNHTCLIRKNLFGVGVPQNDVYISGYHRVIFQIDTTTFEAVHALKLPGAQLLPSEDVPCDENDFYHLELEHNHGFFVSGLAVESFNMAFKSKL